MQRHCCLVDRDPQPRISIFVGRGTRRPTLTRAGYLSLRSNERHDGDADPERAWDSALEHRHRRSRNRATSILLLKVDVPCPVPRTTRVSKYLHSVGRPLVSAQDRARRLQVEPDINTLVRASTLWFGPLPLPPNGGQLHPGPGRLVGPLRALSCGLVCRTRVFPIIPRTCIRPLRHAILAVLVADSLRRNHARLLFSAYNKPFTVQFPLIYRLWCIAV